MSKRSRSPVSEGTIFNHLVESGINVLDDDDLSDSFVQNISESENDSEYESDKESTDQEDISLGPQFEDDTDDDPNYVVSSYDSESENDQDPPRRMRKGTVHDHPTVNNTIEDVVNNFASNNVNNYDMPLIDVIQTDVPAQANDRPNEVLPDNEWTTVEENNDTDLRMNFDFNELPGPKHCPPHDAPPIEYFNLFFTINLLNSFVLRTNQYARNYITVHGPTLSPGSRAREWKNVTLSEMKAFIATILNMGIVRKPTIQSYWSINSSLSTPWFRQMFSRNRFICLLQFFHIVDNTSLPKPGEPGYDPSSKFSPLMEHANRIFRTYYTPHREISVDESLIGTKSHSQMLQYLPNKHHHRWGIKMWMLCDSVSKYCLAFFCYQVNKNKKKETGLAFKVVQKLLQIGHYLNKGYHVFVDNFFTSLPLAQYLYENCTYITGTVRKNRKGIPPKLKEKFDIGEKKYLRKDHILFLGYREKATQKKPVLLLSTKESAISVEVRRKKRHEETPKVKPAIINSYNMYMGGIDGSDQMLYCYLDERRTVKYWKKVVFNIFSRMILNSYILYKENSSGKLLTRFQFTTAIIDELSTEWLSQRTAPFTQHDNGGGDNNMRQNLEFGLESLPGRMLRNCGVCSLASTSTGGKRKRSRTVCKKCKRGVHPTCFGEHKC